MAQLLYWLLPTIVVTVALTVAIVYAIRRRLGGGESTRIQDVYAQPQAPNTQPTSKDIRPAVPSASVWHCKHCQYENASHMSFCDLCAESRNASSVGTNTGDVLIPVYQGVHVPMRRSPHLPPVAPSRLPTSAAASVPSRPPSLAPSSSSVLPAVATFAPASNSVPAPPTSMRDSTPMRNAQHSRDAPPGAPVSFSLTNSQRKRVKTEAELTFIRATNAVARGDLAAAFKDLNRALLLEPSNTKVCSIVELIDANCALYNFCHDVIVSRTICILIPIRQMMAYRALVVSKMSQPTSSSTSTSGATAAAAAAAATAATIEQDAAHLRRQRALRLCVERAAAARLHGDFKSALMEMKQALECDPSNTKVLSILRTSSAGWIFFNSDSHTRLYIVESGLPCSSVSFAGLPIRTVSRRSRRARGQAGLGEKFAPP